jgi:hypothetical protein
LKPFRKSKVISSGDGEADSFKYSDVRSNAQEASIDSSKRPCDQASARMGAKITIVGLFLPSGDWSTTSNRYTVGIE